MTQESDTQGKTKDVGELVPQLIRAIVSATVDGEPRRPGEPPPTDEQAAMSIDLLRKAFEMPSTADDDDVMEVISSIIDTVGDQLLMNYITSQLGGVNIGPGIVAAVDPSKVFDSLPKQFGISFIFGAEMMAAAHTQLDDDAVETIKEDVTYRSALMTAMMHFADTMEKVNEGQFFIEKEHKAGHYEYTIRINTPMGEGNGSGVTLLGAATSTMTSGLKNS